MENDKMKVYLLNASHDKDHEDYHPDFIRMDVLFPVTHHLCMVERGKWFWVDGNYYAPREQERWMKGPFFFFKREEGLFYIGIET